MSFSKLRVNKQGNGVFELILDDPHNDNRLSDDLCQELIEALNFVMTDPMARIVVLAGTSDIFSAGATRETLFRIAEGKTHVKDVELPSRMLNFPLPIIAGLEGHAIGGGLMLALCCDIVVAAETSRYGMNFTDLGFTPGMGTTGLLPALVGTSFATEMILSATFYKGKDLRGRGLFTHIVPKADVLPVARDLAKRMSDKPRHVLELVKREMTEPRRKALENALSREHEMHLECFSRPETVGIIDQNYLDKFDSR